MTLAVEAPHRWTEVFFNKVTTEAKCNTVCHGAIIMELEDDTASEAVFNLANQKSWYAMALRCLGEMTAMQAQGMRFLNAFQPARFGTQHVKN